MKSITYYFFKHLLMSIHGCMGVSNRTHNKYCKFSQVKKHMKHQYSYNYHMSNSGKFMFGIVPRETSPHGIKQTNLRTCHQHVHVCEANYHQASDIHAPRQIYPEQSINCNQLSIVLSYHNQINTNELDVGAALQLQEFQRPPGHGPTANWHTVAPILITARPQQTPGCRSSR